MAGLDEILRSLPMDQLARQLGVDEATASQAASLALPALLGGLQANARDRDGASSIMDALGQHSGSMFDEGIDLERLDTRDGEKISSHIFGSNQDDVVQALGGAGGASVGGSLIRRLLPMLAPIVLSYLARQMQGGGAGRGRTTGGSSGPALPTQQGGQREAGAPGSLEDLLGQVLGGAAGGPAAQTGREQSQAQGGGSILDMLGGLLGGGRR